jgi:hypothetical protein
MSKAYVGLLEAALDQPEPTKELKEAISKVTVQRSIELKKIESRRRNKGL